MATGASVGVGAGTAVAVTTDTVGGGGVAVATGASVGAGNGVAVAGTLAGVDTGVAVGGGAAVAGGNGVAVAGTLVGGGGGVAVGGTTNLMPTANTLKLLMEVSSTPGVGVGRKTVGSRSQVEAAVLRRKMASRVGSLPARVRSALRKGTCNNTGFR